MFYRIVNNLPDSIHVLGQRWGLVGTVGRWLALATYYWPNIGPTYLHQQLLWCCRPNVGTTQLDQQLFWRCRPSIGLTATQPTVILTLLVQCWPNTIHANLCQQIFFNFKYYLTCAYAIIRSILTTKKFLTVYMVWLTLDGHTYLINERKKLILYKIYLLWINFDHIARGYVINR